MAPDAEDCESARLHEGCGGRVGPVRGGAERAWAECEGSPGGSARRLLPAPGHKGSPGGSARRLLPAPGHESRLQAGLTLGLHSKYPHKPLAKSIVYKTKFQKRKEKLVEVLRPPYFLLSMILLIISIHLWSPQSWGAALEFSPAQWRAQPWRLLSYALVHAHARHLALNALVALAVGWPLEREQGWWRVAAVWAGGVLGGALGAGALQPRSLRVVGASAAVYALLTAHLPNVCLRFGHIPLWWFRPLSVLVLGLSEGCWALVRGAGECAGSVGTVGTVGTPSPPSEQVAWAAHVLGAAVGVPLAFLVFTGENEKRWHVLVCRALSALLLAAAALLAGLHYALWDEEP